MNGSIVWRLVWKEYRLQRAFWLAMATLTVMGQWAVFTFMRGEPEEVPAIFGLALGLSAFYALGCGATLFATEHETGTYEFQRSLPVSARQMFLGKLTFAAISIPAFVGLLWLLALAWTHGRLPSPDSHLDLWGLFGFGALEMLAWGTFFSLTGKQPLKAAVLGATAASVTVYFATATAHPFSGGQIYVTSLPNRMFIVALLALTDVYLGLRWFRDATVASDDDVRLPRCGTIDENMAATSYFRSPEPPFGFARLLWQQWRQSGRLLVTLSILVLPLLSLLVWHWICLFTIGRGSDPGFGGLLFMPMALAAAPLSGTYVFLADQRHLRARFLAERGIGAGGLWLSRQIPFAAISLFLTIPLAVIMLLNLLAAKELPGEAPSMSSVLGVLFGFVLLGFSSGQLCSMFLRSSLLAGFFAIVLTVVLSGWAKLMWFFEISWWWSVAPIPLVFLLATWLRSPHWMLERGGLRGWRWPGLVLVTSIASLLVSVAAYRVYEIPQVDLGFSPEEFAKPAAPEAGQTAEMYQRAYDLYDDTHRPTFESWKGNAAGTIAAWLKDNRQTIALTLKATQRPTCDFRSMNPRGGFDWKLGRLLIESATALESEGKLDAALDRYIAALRLSVHMRMGVSVGWADAIETRVYRRLLVWAAQPGQTPQRIRAAIRQIGVLTNDLPSRCNVVKYEYQRMLGIISKSPKALAEMHGDLPDHEREFFSLIVGLQSLPWERARALRALGCTTAVKLSVVRRIETCVSQGEQGNCDRFWWCDSEADRAWRRKTPIMLFGSRVVHLGAGDIVRTATHRRAVRLQLAIKAWQIEHGRLPESLDVLLGPDLKEVPVDPYSGEPFRYFPKGLPAAVTRREVRPDHEGRRAEVIVAAGEPFIWSIGPDIRIRPEEDVANKYVFHDTGYRARTEQEVWSRGWLFPIP